MAGVFISYRRVDTMGWAGRLCADLTRKLGRDNVFMDVAGSIPRGADFEQRLEAGVCGCDALLTLIGPRWLECREVDGTRRIDVANDWVRNETVGALRRQILVVPVLLGNAALPAEAVLPEDLRPLIKREHAVISDERWDYDVGQLLNDLIRQLPQLAALDDVTSANSGIALLRDLTSRHPLIAETIIRSREVLEDTTRQIGRLELFKDLHDALHTIEFECLRPIRESAHAPRLRPFRVKFAGEARHMQERLNNDSINPALCGEIIDSLALVGEAFQQALDHPGDDGTARLLGELESLISGLPSRLDAGLADAAEALNLSRLTEFMSALRAHLSTDATATAGELKTFIAAIDALQRLDGALRQQVTEHSQLQRLDSKLRAVCLGTTGQARLAAEWSRIKLARARLQPPYSPALLAASQDLASIEAEIDHQFGDGGTDQDASHLLSEYFLAVGTVFRQIDMGLRDFCGRLSDVNKPLSMVLDMSRPT